MAIDTPPDGEAIADADDYILQTVIGESTPGEILKQLEEIDETEERFRRILT